MERGMGVQGVGKHPQETTVAMHMPGVLEDGAPIIVDSPVAPESHLPALTGLKTLEGLHVVIDCRRSQRKVHIGKDTKITPARTTNTAQLHPAISGHLMVPLSHFGRRSNNSNGLQLYGNTAAPSSADGNKQPVEQEQEQSQTTTTNTGLTRYQ